MSSTKPKSKPPCPYERYWRVKTGDTLYLIALKTGTTVAVLTELNPGINPDQLQPDQLICLPQKKVCPSGVFWVVATGDTLFQIARATNSTVDDLLTLNPKINPLNLQVGQIICLPG